MQGREMTSVARRYAPPAKAAPGSEGRAPVVLMVSGGADSTALLVLAATSKLDIGDGRSFRQSTRAEGKKPQVRILSHETRAAGPWYAELFKIKADDPVYAIRRLNSVDGCPLSLERTVVPLVRFPRLEGIDLGVFSLYEVFGFYGKVVDATFEHLDIAELSVHDAHFLGVEPGGPAMAYDCISYDQDGEAIEHTRTLRRGDLGFYTVRY